MRCFFLAFLVAVTALTGIKTANAGAGAIYVTDQIDRSCPGFTKPIDQEFTSIHLSSKEVGTALENFFTGEKNPDLVDAIIVNAGMKFCGQAERKIVFEMMLDHLATAGGKNRIEIFSQYSRNMEVRKIFYDRFDKEGLSAAHRKNLEKLAGKIVRP